jgi:hypothetical protein
LSTNHTNHTNKIGQPGPVAVMVATPFVWFVWFVDISFRFAEATESAAEEVATRTTSPMPATPHRVGGGPACRKSYVSPVSLGTVAA